MKVIRYMNANSHDFCEKGVKKNICSVKNRNKSHFILSAVCVVYSCFCIPYAIEVFKKKKGVADNRLRTRR